MGRYSAWSCQGQLRKFLCSSDTLYCAVVELQYRGNPDIHIHSAACPAARCSSPISNLVGLPWRFNCTAKSRDPNFESLVFYWIFIVRHYFLDLGSYFSLMIIQSGKIGTSLC
jgi:hypothetical protein